MPDVSASGLQQMLANMQLAGESGAQRVAELVEPFGWPERGGLARVVFRRWFWEDVRDRDGIVLALPEPASARHRVMQSRPEAWAGDVDQLHRAEHGGIDRRLAGGHPPLDLSAE